jgi:hypothetical protein
VHATRQEELSTDSDISGGDQGITWRGNCATETLPRANRSRRICRVPEKAVARLHAISAGPKDSASLDNPNAITPVSRTLVYARDLTLDLDPYTVAVVDIRAE